MFGFNKKKEGSILAAASGTLIALADVHDEVFSQKMLGDGVAVIPTDGTIYSPVNGVVADVTETLHAYCISSDDGLDILVHIGIDTVELKGEGFTPMVKSGDRVKAGDVIAKADLNLIKEKGYPIETPIIITNIDAVKEFASHPGDAAGGQTAAITYKL